MCILDGGQQGFEAGAFAKEDGPLSENLGVSWRLVLPRTSKDGENENPDSTIFHSYGETGRTGIM